MEQVNTVYMFTVATYTYTLRYGRFYDCAEMIQIAKEAVIGLQIDKIIVNEILLPKRYPIIKCF